MSLPRNRLALEKSPYLRQHAGNPVDWYPWGDEAFAKARAEDKPVFLSVGYSACHWCHVMERESFEDREVAALLNRLFVSVKVDREERPDVDHYYMSVCMALTGSGGWPLTIVTTPDRTPFFAGTYFPKASKYGRQGLLEILPRLAEVWKTRRGDVLAAAARAAASAASAEQRDSEAPLGESLLHEAFEALAAEYDEEEGGFGTAPKFPTPHHLLFLLRYGKRSGKAEAVRMVETTLSRMREGGIFDQIGFGFHRYSTDKFWRVPHFEKMLYDQALLTLACTEAFQATGNARYRRTAEETLDYVRRELTSKEGGFFASEDADAEGEEGRYYLWTAAEIRNALSPEDADLALRLFRVEAGGASILRLDTAPEETAAATGVPPGDLEARAESLRAALLTARQNRARPAKDTKVLVDWNGLMIAALAKASQAFGEPGYAEAAARAADFVLSRMRAPDGGILHRWIDGEAKIPGFLDDLAFLAWGLIELYEAAFDSRCLKEALDLCRFALDHYWDEVRGGFFFTSVRADDLPGRKKELVDGAYPSGNSVMALNLVRLGRMTGDVFWEDKAHGTLEAMSSLLVRAPQAATFALTALDFAVGPSSEFVIAGMRDSAETAALLKEVRRPFLPNKVVLLREQGGDADIAELAPFTGAMTALGGQPAAYVCSDRTCRSPVSGSGELRAVIADLK